MRLHHWCQEWSVHCSLRLLWWNWVLRLHGWSKSALRTNWMHTRGNCLHLRIAWLWRSHYRTGLHLFLDERSLSLWDCAWLDLSRCLWWEWSIPLIVSRKLNNDVLLIWRRSTFKLLQDLLLLLWWSHILARDNLGLKWIIKISSLIFYFDCCFSSIWWLIDCA